MPRRTFSALIDDFNNSKERGIYTSEADTDVTTAQENLLKEFAKFLKSKGYLDIVFETAGMVT